MKFVEQTLRWIVIAAVFALPLVPCIVTNGLFFPYITGKNFTFRLLVELIAAAWLALALVVPAYRPRRSWILAAFAIFVLIIGAADISGAYPFKSIWSNYERMEGWVTLAHLLAYLVVAASVLTSEKLWRRLFLWSLGISFFLSLYGLMQIAGLVALDLGGTASLAARIDATFGNPIYLGVYMLFHVFLGALLIFQEGKRPLSLTEKILWPAGLALALLYQISLHPSNIGEWLAYLALIVCVAGLVFTSLRWLLTAVIAFDALALFLSGTRGAMLGLIGGALLALVLYAFSADGGKRMRQATVGLIAALVVVGGSLKLAQHTAFVQSVGFLDRLASISLSDNTTKARLLNMGIAWHGVQERPLLGWGQENYAVVFDKYYDPRMYAQEQWFDRVHDSIFDWLIAGGILGLLAYLSVFGTALWALWRRGAQTVNNFLIAERAILTGLLVGDFVQNLTVFDNITSWILLVTVLGYIAYRSASQMPIFSGEFLPRWSLGIAGGVTIILAGVSAWAINEPAYAANLAIIQAIQPQSAGLEKNLAYFKQAISYQSFGMQEAREQLAQIAIQLITNNNVPADIKQQFTQTAVQELDAQAKMSPLDARFPLFAAGVLNAAGDYKVADTELARAHQLSPDKQTILYEMAQNSLAEGNVATALADLKQAFELDTENTTARIYYAATLIQAGQENEADTILAPIISTGAAADPRITTAYSQKGEYTKLVPIWAAHVKAQPSDQQGYLTLAAIYYAEHDNADAIATLQQLEAAIPSAKQQAEQLISGIENGTIKTQ